MKVVGNRHFKVDEGRKKGRNRETAFCGGEIKESRSRAGTGAFSGCGLKNEGEEENLAQARKVRNHGCLSGGGVETNRKSGEKG